MKLKKILRKIDKFLAPKKVEGGYYMIMLVMVFATVGILVSSQVAKEAVKYRQITNFTSVGEETDDFLEDIGKFVLANNSQLRVGFYELGKEINFSQEGIGSVGKNDIKNALGIPVDEINRDLNYGVDVVYDFISAAIVPVPTAYNFSSFEKKGLRPGSNGLKPNTTINSPYNLNMINGGSPAETVDLAFGSPETGEPGAICDPESNWDDSLDRNGKLNYNIFKRDGQTPSDNFEAVLTPNYSCENVVLKEIDFKNNKYRNGGQIYVDRDDSNAKGVVGTPNFYYTVPALGMGSAGSECSPHVANFGKKWNGTDEFMDPLDDPCNWNILRQGEAVQVGLTAYNGEEIKAMEGRDFNNLSYDGVQPFSLLGSNLEADLNEISKGAFYEQFGQNDILMLRVRLRCSDGSVNCHPLERYEFYDEFVDETLAGQRIPGGGPNQLYDPNLVLTDNDRTDYTPRVLDHGIVDGNEFFVPNQNFNVSTSLDVLFQNDLFSVNSFGRDLFNSEITIRTLRALSKTPSFNYKINVLDGNARSLLNRFFYDSSFLTSNQNLSSNLYNLFGLDNVDDDQNYYPLFSFTLNEVRSPELFLRNLDGFVRAINRQNGNSEKFLIDHVEYQIVSSKPLGSSEYYVVLEEGGNFSGAEKVILRSENDSLPSGGNVFSNVSN